MKRVAPVAGFREFVENAMVSWKVPGLAVAAVRDGEAILVETFGFRDLANERPVTDRTRFAIGSCTKAFTATAAGMLADEGLLDLDRPLVEILPGCKLQDETACGQAALRDLLIHRTGVPAYDALWYFQRLSREEIVERVAHLEPSAPFRDRFQYSNLLYAVAGLAVGRAVGGSWEDVVGRRIFEPLGMDDASFSVRDLAASADHALPYAEVGGQLVEIPLRDVDALGPASSINASLRDMVQWLKFQIGRGRVSGRDLISASSLDQIHGPQMAIRDKEIADLVRARLYGQGWYLSDHRGHPLIEHPGGIDGFSAIVSFLPQDGIGVAVLTNRYPTLLMSVVARETLDRFLGLDPYDWSALYDRLLAGYVAASGATPEPDAATQVPSAADLRMLQGRFLHPAFGLADVELEDATLTIRIFGCRGVLEPAGDHQFRLVSPHLPVWTARFQAEPGREATGLVLPLEPKVGGVPFRRRSRP